MFPSLTLWEHSRYPLPDCLYLQVSRFAKIWLDPQVCSHLSSTHGSPKCHRAAFPSSRSRAMETDTSFEDRWFYFGVPSLQTWSCSLFCVDIMCSPFSCNELRLQILWLWIPRFLYFLFVLGKCSSSVCFSGKKRISFLQASLFNIPVGQSEYSW